MPQFLRETFGSYAPLIIPLLHIAGMLLAGFVVLRLIDSGLKRLRLLIPPGERIGNIRIEQRAETLRQVVRSVGKVVVVVILGLTISSELGFPLGPLLASVGIVSLAIGFGAQSLVKDIISGFFILFEDQFGVGDVVRIDEYAGSVEHMTLRVTVLRNMEGEVHVIPNGNIHAVTVLTKDWSRAVVDVTVSHKEDLNRVFAVLSRVGESLARDWPAHVLEQPAVSGIEKLSIDGITIRCMVKTPPTKQWDLMREWRRRIKEEFDREGIELAQRPLAIAPEEVKQRT